MTVKHATASAFVFGLTSAGWRLGLVHQPRLDRLMVPGGHVERDESQEQAVFREVAEESGLDVRLLSPPTLPLPKGYPHPLVAQPWWLNEMTVPQDNHLSKPHVHLDHQYVAVADDPRPGRAGAHAFGWYAEDEVVASSAFDDTKLLAKVLFSCIDTIAVGRFDAGELMRRFVTAAS